MVMAMGGIELLCCECYICRVVASCLVGLWRIGGRRGRWTAVMPERETKKR